MIKAQRMALVAGLAIATAVAAVSSPAAASGPTERASSTQARAWSCDDRYLCLYGGEQGAGKPCQYQADHKNIWKGKYACKRNGKNVKVKSVYNRTNSAYNLYPQTEYRGKPTKVCKGQRVGKLEGVASFKKVKC